jgi:chromosome segregation ATPase
MSLEKTNDSWKTRLQSIEQNLDEKQTAEKELRALVAQHQESDHALKTRIIEMEKINSLLQTRVADIEKHNQGLLDAVKTVRTDDPVINPSQSEESDEEFILTENRAMHVRAASNPSELKDLEKNELVRRVQELEEMERFQHKKIHELTENLNHLRREVETVASNVDRENKLLVEKSKTRDMVMKQSK